MLNRLKGLFSKSNEEQKKNDNIDSKQTNVEVKSKKNKNRDLTKLKEEKEKRREEKEKRREENARKRKKEEEALALQKEEEEKKRKEELLKVQKQKQEEYEARKSSKQKEKKEEKKVYEAEDNSIDLFGIEVKDLQQGMIVQGEILLDNKDEYIVEIKDSFKEAFLPKVELNDTVSVGDELELLIYRHTNDDFYLSQRRLANKKNKDALKAKQESQEVVKGIVKDYQDPFYIVEFDGKEANVYKTNISLRIEKKPQNLLGQTFDFVIKSVREKGDIELTRIPLLKKELEEKKSLFEVGKLVTVSNFTKNKAGIEFQYEGVRVFIPFSNLSHTFVERDNDLSFLEGKEAIITKCSEERYGYNIVASIKDLEPNPFEEFIKNNEIDGELECEVVKVEDYGVIVELTKGVRGLLHKNDSSQGMIDFSNIKVGDKVSVKIKEFDLNRKRISLKN